jgi:uncharacterized cupredoxin-like copper-binding protein
MNVSMRIGLAALAAIAVVAAAPTQDKALVKFKLGKDASVQFKSTIKTDMEIMGTAQSNTIVMTQSVSAIETKEGWTTVRFKTDDFKMEGDSMMGMESGFDSVKEVTIKMEVDEQGRTRNVTLENTEKIDPMLRQLMTGSMKSDQIAGFMGVHFPKEEVGVGSKWAVELDAAQMFDKSEMITSVEGKLPISYEVTGFEEINGKRNVKVHSIMTGTVNLDIASPAGDLKAVVQLEFDTEYWVDVATGILTKSVGKANIDNDFGMGSMTQKLAVNIERLEPRVTLRP